MLLPAVLAIVVVAALLRGGSLRNITNLRLRWLPIVLVSLGLQLLIFTPLLRQPLIPVFRPQLYVLSMLILIVWVAANWRVPGMLLMAAGLLTNTAAIAANGGYMPTSLETVQLANALDTYGAGGTANNSRILENPRLWLLTDIIPVPDAVPVGGVLSIGDVLLTIGASLLCYRAIRGLPPAASDVEGPHASHVEPRESGSNG